MYKQLSNMPLRYGRKDFYHKQWRIEKQLDCNSYNLVYAIFCAKENCKLVYIGETKRMLRFTGAIFPVGTLRRPLGTTSTCQDLRVTAIESCI